MESPVKDWPTVDIRITVNENKDIILDLLTAHGIIPSRYNSLSLRNRYT